MTSSLYQKCQACKEPIVWMTTRNKKWTPVNVDSIKTDEVIFNPNTMISHFATCPFADKFRKVKIEEKKNA